MCVCIDRLETVYGSSIRRAELEARLQYLKVCSSNEMSNGHMD